MARRVIIPLTAICIGAAGLAYAYFAQPAQPPAIRSDATQCDSCSARKKDLGRLRQALNPPPMVSK